VQLNVSLFTGFFLSMPSAYATFSLASNTCIRSNEPKLKPAPLITENRKKKIEERAVRQALIDDVVKEIH
jgi:hypothetical protein